MASSSPSEINTSICGNWGYTGFKKTSFDYLWIIEYCRLYAAECTSSTLYAPTFKDNEGNSEWGLSLTFYFNQVKILLQSVKYDKSSELKATYSISLLNEKNERITTVKKMKPHNFKNGTSFVFILKSDIFNEYDLLIGDTFSILCKIVILHSESSLSGSKLTSKLDVPCLTVRNLLAADLSKPFDNGKFSDVILVADDREFHSHKVILSARSEVFAAMFEHQMKENTLNRVVITDVKADVLEEMLRFIYTSQSPNIKKMAKELFVAADKYSLTQLKQICEYELASSINVESAAELLKIADLYNDNNLKSDITKFINLNSHKVVKTDGWKNLIKTHGGLVAEIYTAAVENQMGNVKIN